MLVTAVVSAVFSQGRVRRDVHRAGAGAASVHQQAVTERERARRREQTQHISIVSAAAAPRFSSVTSLAYVRACNRPCARSQS